MSFPPPWSKESEMNHPLELTNELVAEAFADYRKNQAYRIDEVTEAKAHDQGARGRQPQA
jgi:hypothetical protein